MPLRSDREARQEGDVVSEIDRLRQTRGLDRATLERNVRSLCDVIASLRRENAVLTQTLTRAQELGSRLHNRVIELGEKCERLEREAAERRS
jgi:predicted nuclease with TOPRIM domain